MTQIKRPCAITLIVSIRFPLKAQYFMILKQESAISKTHQLYINALTIINIVIVDTTDAILIT